MATYLISAALLSLSALFSGLNLGLLGLDKTELRRKMKLGDELAARVLRIREQGNLLLCTLLLGNVAVNAALAIFLENIAGGLVAGILTTGLIVIFGEIVPQAYCSRNAIVVGAYTDWLTRVFIFLLYPVAGPLAWILDWVLGEEFPTIYSKEELQEIIRHHHGGEESPLDADEQRIVIGALSFSELRARDVLTPRTVVFALEEDAILDQATLAEIRTRGFTRIPIYREQIDEVVGVLNAKDLIGIAPGTPVKDVRLRGKPLVATEAARLDELLNRFVATKAHLALVVDEYGGLKGIVTLEDVMEEILRTEIVDELDHAVDLRAEARRRARRIVPPAEGRPGGEEPPQHEQGDGQ